VFFIVSTWVVIIGGGWFMVTWAPQLGSLGPWMAAAVLIIVTAVFLWWRWNSRAWMKIDLFKDDEAKLGEPADSIISEAELIAGGPHGP
jgi:hypothetical protein